MPDAQARDRRKTTPWLSGLRTTSITYEILPHDCEPVQAERRHSACYRQLRRAAPPASPAPPAAAAAAAAAQHERAALSTGTARVGAGRPVAPPRRCAALGGPPLQARALAAKPEQPTAEHVLSRAPACTRAR